ncbi:DUF1365 domain-containing protein [Streptomyces sp. NPDC001185]|uniref:DUF1365 domain-containing protein n=1 Tax=Streptomyces sp. NPDC001185 TaxID=3154380 RepID=UPI00332CB3A4
MVTATPALYPCTVSHVRTAPTRYALRHRTYMWLTDPDRPPRLPLPLRPLAGFDARDHFDGDQPTIRAGLDRFLASHGIDLHGGPVTMLAHARVLGHVFNPLTLYWCHDPDGTPRCVVAEVHNTYGERHCYLLLPEDTGTARVPGPVRESGPVPEPGSAREPRGAREDQGTTTTQAGTRARGDGRRTGNPVYRTEKRFYVSPFFPVDGAYRMRLPLPDDRLDLTVRLERADTRPFTATVRGTRREATAGTLLRAALRHPWSTVAVSAAIRVHGIRLYLRGLPVQPRPRHRNQESDT